MGSPSAAAQAVSDQYVYVRELDQFVERETGELLTRQSFEFRWPGSPKGADGARGVYSIFRQAQPDELNVVDAVTYRLGQGRFVSEDYGRCVNLAPCLARPNAGTRITRKMIRPWLALVSQLFPDALTRADFIGWLAWVAQNPSERPARHLVIGGRSGIGKSLVLKPMIPALGLPNVGEIIGLSRAHHSEWRHRRKLMIFCDDLQGEVSLRRLSRIAEPSTQPIAIRRKTLGQYRCADTTAVIASTSSPVAAEQLAADPNLLVLWSPAVMGASRAYADLVAWYDEGGAELTAQWLLELDLSDSTFANCFDPPPPTSAGARPHDVARRLQAGIDARWSPFQSDVVAIPEVLEWICPGVEGADHTAASVRLIGFLTHLVGARRLGCWRLGLPPRGVAFPARCSRRHTVTLFSVRNHGDYSHLSREHVLAEFWTPRAEAQARRRGPERPWLKLAHVSPPTSSNKGPHHV